MASARQRLSAGELRLVARDDELLDAALEHAARAAATSEHAAGEVALAGRRAWLKGSPLRGKARLRHALRAHVLRRPLPRVGEYGNLRWLAQRLFRVPDALAAGVLWRAGAPAYQLLVTGLVEGALDLRAHLAARGALEPELLDELAGEVARMHALGFVHRDLYPRNLLVTPAPGPRRLVFVDAWRGGARTQLRGPAYDLGCLMLHAPELLSRDERRRFLDGYVAARARQGRPVAREPLLAAVERERRALRARLARRPDLLRGRPLPAVEWRP